MGLIQFSRLIYTREKWDGKRARLVDRKHGLANATAGPSIIDTFSFNGFDWPIVNETVFLTIDPETNRWKLDSFIIEPLTIVFDG